MSHHPLNSPWQPPRGGWRCAACDAHNADGDDKCHRCNRDPRAPIVHTYFMDYAREWQACYDEDDTMGAEGCGPTREAAIADLLARFPRTE